VPVAYEVARALGVELDVFVVRKLGVPGHEELAMGAIAPGGVRVLNEEVVRTLGLGKSEIEAVTRREERELARRERQYRDGAMPVDVRGKTVILVDDGLATGSSMRAAVAALKNLRAGKVVVAVPVAPAEACESLREVADDLVCAETPEPFFAVGAWYEDFDQVEDEEVRALLAHARAKHEEARP
jgi:putative phosphoribosyl transferase